MYTRAKLFALSSLSLVNTPAPSPLGFPRLLDVSPGSPSCHAPSIVGGGHGDHLPVQAGDRLTAAGADGQLILRSPLEPLRRPGPCPVRRGAVRHGTSGNRESKW